MNVCSYSIKTRIQFPLLALTSAWFALVPISAILPSVVLIPVAELLTGAILTGATMPDGTIHE